MQKTKYEDHAVRRALIMFAEGFTSRDISLATTIPKSTLDHWRVDRWQQIEALRGKQRGSGQIAGPTYYRQFKWGGS